MYARIITKARKTVRAIRTHTLLSRWCCDSSGICQGQSSATSTVDIAEHSLEIEHVRGRSCNRWLGGGLLCVALGTPLTTGVAFAAASEYPSQQPVRLIVPYPAGGGTDYFARTVSERMSQELGQRVIVENRPGAATIIGADSVARAKPDGYTILLGDNATYAVNPSLYTNLPYDPLEDFEPVTLTARFALLLVTHPSVPVDDVNEFIAWVKDSPGKVDFGSPGTGSPHHLAMELLEQRADIDLTHIPYKGGAPATQDLLAGVIPTMFLDLPTAAPHIQAGKLKALAVASDKPISSMPELPHRGCRSQLTRLRSVGVAGIQRA